MMCVKNQWLGSTEIIYINLQINNLVLNFVTIVPYGPIKSNKY